ncbi:MAG: branched-chain amino acid transport system permease protein [Actinomycetota bacterium]|nr:branched-chain amino acid transport system permease protein [Actinomycetota bacterium]
MTPTTPSGADPSTGERLSTQDPPLLVERSGEGETPRREPEGGSSPRGPRRRRELADLPPVVRYAICAGILGAAYLLPWVGRVPVIGPQIQTQGIDWPSALFNMSYFVLLALGLNVVVGFAGLLDLGYVGFFAVGAYTVAVLASPDSDLDQRWPWLACVPVAIGVCLFSGLLLGWPTLRLRGDYLAIVTLGFAEIIRVFADSSSLLRGDRGLGSIPHPPGNWSDGSPIFSVRDATPYYWLGLTLIVLMVLAVRNLKASRVGRSWLAIREDEEAAELMGVRTVRFKLWAFAIGAAIGGFGGVLFAGEQGFLNSATFQLMFSVLVLAGVVMGGSGSIPGAILGGALISYIPDRLRGVQIAGTDAFEYRFLIFGLMIIIIMIFRPQGLLPDRRRVATTQDQEER